jgi:TonB family protein
MKSLLLFCALLSGLKSPVGNVIFSQAEDRSEPPFSGQRLSPYELLKAPRMAQRNLVVLNILRMPEIDGDGKVSGYVLSPDAILFNRKGRGDVVFYDVTANNKIKGQIAVYLPSGVSDLDHRQMWMVEPLGMVRETNSNGAFISLPAVRFWRYAPLPSIGLLPATRTEQVEEPIVGEVYEVGGDVTAPVLIFSVEPVYPEDARQNKLDGLVHVDAVVNTKGKPLKVHVDHPLGHGLDEEAVKVVKQWVFKPGSKNGAPVNVHLVVSVVFRL